MRSRKFSDSVDSWWCAVGMKHMKHNTCLREGMIHSLIPYFWGQPNCRNHISTMRVFGWNGHSYQLQLTLDTIATSITFVPVPADSCTVGLIANSRFFAWEAKADQSQSSLINQILGSLSLQYSPYSRAPIYYNHSSGLQVFDLCKQLCGVRGESSGIWKQQKIDIVENPSEIAEQIHLWFQNDCIKIRKDLVKAIRWRVSNLPSAAPLCIWKPITKIWTVRTMNTSERNCQLFSNQKIYCTWWLKSHPLNVSVECNSSFTPKRSGAVSSMQTWWWIVSREQRLLFP